MEHVPQSFVSVLKIVMYMQWHFPSHAVLGLQIEVPHKLYMGDENPGPWVWGLSVGLIICSVHLQRQMFIEAKE